MPNSEIISSFKNTEDGIEVFVTAGHLGFHVSIKDLDAGEFIGFVVVYKDKAKALKKAENIAAGIA